MRSKQKVRFWWLLLPLVAGLPVAVFLAERAGTQRSSAPAESEGLAPAVPVPPSDEPLADEPEPAAPTPPARSKTAPGEPSAPEIDVPAAREPVVALPVEPLPEPKPAAQPDWTAVSRDRDRWPKQTRLTAAVSFPIVVGGKSSGSMQAPMGTEVAVTKITADLVEIAYADCRTSVPADRTTLGKQILEAGPLPAAEPATATPTPDAAKPAPEEKPAPEPKPTADDNLLDPQKNYLKHAGAAFNSSTELYKVLAPHTRADPSLEVSAHPEIYGGVTLMMPLREALKKLGLDKEIVPSKSPISHPGIPFYFRPFANKETNDLLPGLVPGSDDYFNLLYLITDASDRVVGIEFVCETPHGTRVPNSDFLTYNYVLNRAKIVKTYKVRHEVEHLGDDLLVVETSLIDAHGKCREIVRWYLPTRIGNFINHVIRTRLSRSSGP